MKYFNFKKPFQVERSPFSIYIGYKSAIDVYQGYKLKLMVDYVAKIVRQNSLLDDFNEEMENHGNYTKAIEELYINQHVLADYGNHKIYKIANVEETMTPMSPFPNEQYETYYDYFY